MWSELRRSAMLALLMTAAACASASSWRPVGPDGGDVRSLAADPHDADHILLGTSTGQLFASRDGGESWSRLAHLGEKDEYVLDNIVFDPARRGAIYVAGWDVEGSNSGDLFRSTDDGKTWEPIPAMHGKSVRAFAMAPSDSKVLVAGALDGVYRSTDAGASWERISPPDDVEIKNIESLAVDPRDPAVIYAGTWHLPWKTIDGGYTWISIKKGWIDDSDVFSIVLVPRNPDLVYASACTGIYKSENGAALFRKLKGIPTSARRTRKLQVHPSDPNIVYAGTTEGLFRSLDGGKSWKPLTASSVIVNDILVDARRPGRVLLATDRSGVLRSENAGRTFVVSNRGFAHRQVAALLVDRSNSNVVYAGVVNDKEFGGVFLTRDAGDHWKQISDGLSGRDVFTLRQNEDGVLLAGTNRGVFVFNAAGKRWQPLNWHETAAQRGRQARTSRGEVSVFSPVETARISDLKIVDGKWYTASSAGLFTTQDAGHTWQGGPVLNQQNFIAVEVSGRMVATLAPRNLLMSVDGGITWYPANLPSYITELFGAAIAGESKTLWLATREGAFRSQDGGETWDHVLAGLPDRNVTAIVYDEEGNRLLATGGTNLYESTNRGRSWHRTGESTWRMRGLSFGNGGRIFTSSAFDGVLALPDAADEVNASSSGGDQ
jgi:photosystem II stability/assembly factor-like uncharacterized protein